MASLENLQRLKTSVLSMYENYVNIHLTTVKKMRLQGGLADRTYAYIGTTEFNLVLDPCMVFQAFRADAETKVLNHFLCTLASIIT